MTAVNFKEEGLKWIGKAVEEDKNENYVEALSHYKTGLEYLAQAIKCVRTKLMEKSIEWMERAEELKDLLASKNKAKVKSVDGAPTTKKNGASKQREEDDDKNTLRTSLQSAILTETPNVPWDSVAGLERAKEALKEAVIMPIKFPQLFTGNRTPWKGILLYGPPGTGKSYLAKAVATEAKATFFSISSSDLVSKYQGESEKLVRELFELARDNKPSIIFVDEVDSLCGSRGDNESESSRRIKTEFLVQMNGVGNDQSGVLVLGATNIPWGLDAAIRRRFERRIYIDLPDEHARLKIFQINIGTTPHNLTLQQLRYLAQATEGYSGADISTLVRDALYQPIRRLQSATHFKKVFKPDPNCPTVNKVLFTPCSPRDSEGIEMHWTELSGDELDEPLICFADFEAALRTTRKSVSDEDLIKQEKFTREFGIEG